MELCPVEPSDLVECFGEDAASFLLLLSYGGCGGSRIEIGPPGPPGGFSGGPWGTLCPPGGFPGGFSGGFSGEPYGS